MQKVEHNLWKWNRLYGSGLEKVHSLVLFHPVFGLRPSFIAHGKWSPQSVSLHVDPSQWKLLDSTLTASVISASSSVSFSVAVTWQPVWQRDSSAMNQPQIHFTHLSEGIQAKTIKLPCHLSFSLPASPPGPPNSPSFISLCHFSATSFSFFYSASHYRNCSLQNEISKLLQIARYSSKWKGWKGSKQAAGIKEKKKATKIKRQAGRNWFVIAMEAIWTGMHSCNMFTHTFISCAPSLMALIKYLQ